MPSCWPSGDTSPSGVISVPVVVSTPNRVREDFDFESIDVFPVCPVSPRSDGYFPSASSVSSPIALSTPGSPAVPAPGYLLNKATGSFDSTVGSPVTSLLITDNAADLTLLSEPLIPLLDVASACTGPDAASHLPWVSALTLTGLWCPSDKPVALTRWRHTVRRMLPMLIQHLGYSCITRGFWNVSAHRSRPGCWIVPRLSGFKWWTPKTSSLLWCSCSGTLD